MKVNQRYKLRLGLLIVLVMVMGYLRIQSTVSNWEWLGGLTPIGAMALFSGAYFSKWRNGLLFPLLALLVSDIIIMQTVYAQYQVGFLYTGWYWTYLGCLGMVFIARGLLFRQCSWDRVLASMVLAAVFHWVVADIGVCFVGHGTGAINFSWANTWVCYAQALPFMKKLIVSNLLYGGILFGGFELAKRHFPVLSLSEVTSTHHFKP